MLISMLKSGGTCVGKIFAWKWGQILASKRGNLARQRNKMSANLDLFHAFAQAAQRKHKIWLAVDRNSFFFVLFFFKMNMNAPAMH